MAGSMRTFVAETETETETETDRQTEAILKDQSVGPKIAKKKTLTDQFFQIFRKKQTSPVQVGPENIDAKSDSN